MDRTRSEYPPPPSNVTLPAAIAPPGHCGFFNLHAGSSPKNGLFGVNITSQPTCFSLIFSPGARAVSRDLPALEVLPPGPCCKRPVTGAGDLDLSDIVLLYPLIIINIRLRSGRSFLKRCSFRSVENLVNSTDPNFGEVAQPAASEAPRLFTCCTATDDLHTSIPPAWCFHSASVRGAL